MRRFACKRHINAPVDRAWAVLADVGRWPEWNAAVRRVEPLERHALGLGSRVRIYQPNLRPAVWTITAWEPDSCFVWQSAVVGLRMVGSHDIRPSRGGCELALALQFDGWLSALAGFFKGRLAERYIQLEAEGVKARSEQS